MASLNGFNSSCFVIDRSRVRIPSLACLIVNELHGHLKDMKKFVSRLLPGFWDSPGRARGCRRRMEEHGFGWALHGPAAFRRCWAQVDLPRGEIRLVVRKTGKRLLLPIAAPLHEQLLALAGADQAAAPLHPRALAAVNHGRVSS